MHSRHRSQPERRMKKSCRGGSPSCGICVGGHGLHSHSDAQMTDIVSVLGFPHVSTVVSNHITSYLVELAEVGVSSQHTNGPAWIIPSEHL